MRLVRLKWAACSDLMRCGLAYWCEHPDVFAAIADAPDDEARVLAVLKWFIVSWKWIMATIIYLID